MAIDLDDGVGGERTPPLRLPNQGDWVSGHLVHVKKTKAKNKNGDLKNKLIVTVFVKDSSEGAQIGYKDTGYVRPEPNVEAVIHVEGTVFGFWIEAKKTHPDLQVGDVIRWTFKDTSPNPKSGESDFRNRRFDLRKAQESERSAVLACETRFHEIASQDTGLIPESEISSEIAF